MRIFGWPNTFHGMDFIFWESRSVGGSNGIEGFVMSLVCGNQITKGIFLGRVGMVEAEF